MCIKCDQLFTNEVSGGPAYTQVPDLFKRRECLRNLYQLLISAGLGTMRAEFMSFFTNLI